MKIAFAAKPANGTDLYLMAVTREDLKKIKGPHADWVNMLIDAFPEFTGDPGDIVSTVLPGYKYSRFGLVGLGSGDKRTRLSLEKIGGKLMSSLITLPVNDPYIELNGFKADEVAVIASGATLRAYEFRAYMTKKQDQYLSDSITFKSPSPAASGKAFTPLDKSRAAVHWARDLGNEPPNILHPVSFAKRVVAKMKGTNVKVTVFDEKQLTRMGAGAIMAVGQASEQQPRLVILEYNGTGKRNSVPVALVGKGVTFDTGGYSIKTADGMVDMKTDMCGAGAIAAAILSLATRKAKVHVVGALAMVENMISDEAYRPSDIITSLSGQTIEVTNTDAEGRLILADAMWYVQTKYKPKKMIDIATLTGAALVALGEEYAAFYTNDVSLGRELEQSSVDTGDKIWHMPLDPAFNAVMDSGVADMRNTATTRWGGSCTAAAFLQRYVKDGVKWAHIDMAPVAFARGEYALGPAGTTGFGVRLLSDWVENTK
ncbi:MAG TPA: leucyl aminopeptidase [Alphaproteobacteria bacterium]